MVREKVPAVVLHDVVHPHVEGRHRVSCVCHVHPRPWEVTVVEVRCADVGDAENGPRLEIEEEFVSTVQMQPKDCHWDCDLWWEYFAHFAIQQAYHERMVPDDNSPPF